MDIMVTKSTVKKTSTKKSATRKSAPKKRATTKAQQQSARSFHIERSPTPFLTIAITRQTLYWGILSLVVLILGIWIIHLQNEINKIYDAIDISMSESDAVIVKERARR